LAIAVCLCMLTFFANIGNGMAEWITGIRPFAENGSRDLTSSAAIVAYRIASICSNVGGFLLSSILFSWFCSNSISDYFRIKSPLKWKYLAVIGLCFLLAIPAIQLLSELNELISGGAYLMEAQEETSKLRTALLRTDSVAVVVLNVFAMALLPAIGEELFFRGVILRVSFQGTKNIHLGVLLSAILFALVHMEFSNFLAILFMGVLLGYLYVYTGSLLVPIGLHFLNNCVYIILESSGNGSAFVDKLEAGSNSIFWLITGAIALLLFAFLLQRSVNKGNWNTAVGYLMRD